MAQTISGKMRVNYVSKQTGKTVDGTNIFVAEPINSEYGEGCLVDKVYVPSFVIQYEDIKLAKCEVSYDKYGRVKGIRY